MNTVYQARHLIFVPQALPSRLPHWLKNDIIVLTQSLDCQQQKIIHLPWVLLDGIYTLKDLQEYHTSQTQSFADFHKPLTCWNSVPLFISIISHYHSFQTRVIWKLHSNHNYDTYPFSTNFKTIPLPLKSSKEFLWLQTCIHTHAFQIPPMPFNSL